MFKRILQFTLVAVALFIFTPSSQAQTVNHNGQIPCNQDWITELACWMDQFTFTSPECGLICQMANSPDPEAWLYDYQDYVLMEGMDDMGMTDECADCATDKPY